MNYDNLSYIINIYKDDFEHINNPEHDEIFKWRAVKHFQNVWFSEDAHLRPFADLFKDAKKECNVLLDGARISPAIGIVIMAEFKPKEVEYLFREVLFANDSGNIQKRQNNMDTFLDEIEKIRQELFPKFWKYKQDRHAASCYLSLYAPENNYIYKSSVVSKFAKYIETGDNIGIGRNFRLDYYYDMCNQVVDELLKHEDLLKMHDDLIDETYYRDKSRHIMVFDLMYCANCYGYYSGLPTLINKSNHKNGRKDIDEFQVRRQENRILELRHHIKQLEMKCEQYEDISLLNVEVLSEQYGLGLVVEHEVNKITVQFSDVEKKYEINRKFSKRPSFENDEEIVDALTDYAEALNTIKRLHRELEQLQKYNFDEHVSVFSAVDTQEKNENFILDKKQLEQRLKELAETPYTGGISYGAMCYVPSRSHDEEYICLICNKSTIHDFGDYRIRDLFKIRSFINELKENGYDVLLDEHEYCEYCSNSIERSRTNLKIRFDKNDEYHVVRPSLIGYEYLKTFLLGGDHFISNQDFTITLHENINSIYEMTGLGEDIMKSWYKMILNSENEIYKYIQSNIEYEITSGDEEKVFKMTGLNKETAREWYRKRHGLDND